MEPVFLLPFVEVTIFWVVMAPNQAECGAKLMNFHMEQHLLVWTSMPCLLIRGMAKASLSRLMVYKRLTPTIPLLRLPRTTVVMKPYLI